MKNKNIFLFSVVAIFLFLFLFASCKEKTKTSEKTLEMAKELLSGKMADSAIVIVKDYIKKNPKSAEAHFRLGNAYHQKKNYNRAASEYELALKLNPEIPTVHAALGALYYEQGLKIWAKLSKNHPQYIYADTGITYKYGKDGPKTEVKRLEEIVEKDTSALDERFRLRGAYYDMAIEEYSKALKVNPQDSSAHLGLGLTYLERGFVDKAWEEYEALKKTGSRLADQVKYQIEYEKEDRIKWEGFMKQREESSKEK
jgi:tetratricopeptide (TPR) repeat protein